MPNLKFNPRLIIGGFAGGYLSGLLGVGGGIILIPFLVMIMKLDQKTAQGTTLAIIIPLALAGSCGYYICGYFDPRHALMIAIGSMLGVYAGSMIAHKTPTPILTKIFALFMLFIGFKLLLG